MEADDLLCSRNAWEGKGSLVVLLLAERVNVFETLAVDI